MTEISMTEEDREAIKQQTNQQLSESIKRDGWDQDAVIWVLGTLRDRYVSPLIVDQFNKDVCQILNIVKL